MTKEEQVDWLCRLRVDLNNGVIFTPWNEEFTEALDGILEQESCNDAISRQAAIKAICRYCTPEKPERCPTAEICHSYQELKALPPVKPVKKQEPCEDCINREETLKVLMDEWTEFDSGIIDSLVEKIKKLPSVSLAEKVGHWEWDHVFWCRRCSECHLSKDSKYSNYCPNCGAKMEVRNENTDSTND